MNLTLAFQFQGFLISIGVGLLLGAYYDVFRIFRTVFRSEKRAVFYQDVFYMLTSAFVTFLLALGVNYGNVRFYILAGEIIGWCLYFLTVGLVTIRVFRFVSDVLHRFIINPVKKIILHIFHFLCNKVKIIVKKAKIVVINKKKCLKHNRKIVYNQLRFKRKRRRKA